MQVRRVKLLGAIRMLMTEARRTRLAVAFWVNDSDHRARSTRNNASRLKRGASRHLGTPVDLAMRLRLVTG